MFHLVVGEDLYRRSLLSNTIDLSIKYLKWKAKLLFLGKYFPHIHIQYPFKVCMVWNRTIFTDPWEKDPPPFRLFFFSNFAFNFIFSNYKSKISLKIIYGLADKHIRTFPISPIYFIWNYNFSKYYPWKCSF